MPINGLGEVGSNQLSALVAPLVALFANDQAFRWASTIAALSVTQQLLQIFEAVFPVNTAGTVANSVAATVGCVVRY